MIPQETVDLILDTAQIVDVVSDFVTLKRRGTNYTACCPFHNEKTPSFYVSPSKGIYKCFGCGKAGSAVGFIMEHEHYSYTEALRYLAEKYSIEIVEKQEDAVEIELRQRRESLMLSCEFAQNFYVGSLKSQEGRAIGMAYLRSRGLSDETIEKFGLGWAPKKRTALTEAAQAAGYKLDYLVDAGLCVRHEDGKISDRFYERVMFPIHTVSGRVVAWSARTLLSDFKERNIGKYINSPETELYHKSNALYGIYLAKNEIARKDKCYLVEGNIDVLAMHSLGLTNTVASCGTALTPDQVRFIKKFTDNITIMYDGDSAGIHAALKGIDLVLKGGMNVKVVLFPDGDDPDSYSRKHTLDEVVEFIEKSEQDFITFKSDLLMSGAAADPIRKANVINDIADSIGGIPDAVKRSVYVESVAEKFGLSSEILFERMSSSRRKMIEDERIAEIRAQRRAEANLPPLPDEDGRQDETVQDMHALSDLVQNRQVASSEEDLLYFLLVYGTETLDFESDSEFYSGDEADKPTVADFIRSWMEGEGIRMLNPAFQKVYDSYMDLYDAGSDSEEIRRMLMDSPDRETAFVAAQLSVEKYRLTVKSFEEALTKTNSWLVRFVPKAILTYMDNRLTNRLSELKSVLSDTPEDSQLEIMQEIVRIQVMQKNIKVKIGRDKRI